MLSPRAKIWLSAGFFTFTFTLMFLALVHNAAQASSFSSLTLPNTEPIVPTFWLSHSAPWFDLERDDSYQKYLSVDHPFHDGSYVPSDLVPIDSDFTANASEAFKLRHDVSLYFADMARNFWNAFSWDRLYIVSAYRSRGLQDYLIKQWCALIRCAPIGTSEHQAWLALDLKVVARWGRSYALDAAYPNKYSDWLKANAAKYGFHNTYQKWMEIDGKMVEWRHRRYMWLTLAQQLADDHQTFAEYFNSLDQKPIAVSFTD